MFLLKIPLILIILMIFNSQSGATDSISDFGKGIAHIPKGVQGIILSDILEDEGTSYLQRFTFIWCISKAKQLNLNSKTFTAQKIFISPKAQNMLFFYMISEWQDRKAIDKLDLSFVEVAKYCNILFDLIEESQKSPKIKKKLEFWAESYNADIKEIAEKQNLVTHKMGMLFMVSHRILSGYKICEKKTWTVAPINQLQNIHVTIHDFYFMAMCKRRPINKHNIFEYFSNLGIYDAAAEILDPNTQKDAVKIIRHYNDSKQYEKALLLGEKLLSSKNGIMNYGIDIARLYARIGKFSKASELCANVIMARNNRLKEEKDMRPDAHYCIAFYLIRDNKPAESFPYLKEFIALSEKTPKERLKFPLRESFIEGVKKAILEKQITFNSVEEANNFLLSFLNVILKFEVKKDEY